MARAIAIVALALAMPTAAAAASSSVAPVSITVQAKPSPQPYCEECIEFFGRIASSKSACRANRVVGSAVRYRAGSPSGGRTYRDPHFAETDSQGRFSIVVSSGEPLAWMEVTLPRARIGKVTCGAARAKVTLSS